METRFIVKASQRLRRQALQQLSHARHSSSSPKLLRQANPIGDYYASILESSSPAIASHPPTTASSSSTPPKTSAPNKSVPEAAILFSSRLSSPLERRSEIRKKSTLIAGIWVPPRPDEPDNCCMSGCVNCVWDRYGEELEEWAAKSREVEAIMRKESGVQGDKKRQKKLGLVLNDGLSPAGTMDADGGGSETNWGTGLETGFTNDDLFKDIPVGIREFMKQEKKLKEKHLRESSSSG